MQKIKNVIVFVFIVLSRLCWAGLSYSVVGLLLYLFKYDNYMYSIETYIYGMIMCLSWLLIIPVLKVYVEEEEF